MADERRNITVGEFAPFLYGKGLPRGMQLEQLRAPGHPSVLRNPLIAGAFYFAGMIEQWGTGTTRILDWSREAGLPEPEFREEGAAFRVVFFNDPHTPDRLRAMGLNERQVQIIAAVRRTERAAVGERQGLFPDVSAKTIQQDLQLLVPKGLLKAVGEKKGRRYGITR